jgi:Lrp/AsnC family leucine-responsive transcriptional regulator
MRDTDIDRIDQRIIHALQGDARHTSASDIAESLDVSARTVRNHITRLEEEGVIQEYRIGVDYEAAGFQLHTLIVCTAPVHEREQLASRALDVPGVVGVREVMTGEENVHVEVVGVDGNDLSRIGRDLQDLGLQVADEDIIRNDYSTSFDRFAEER